MSTVAASNVGRYATVRIDGMYVIGNALVLDDQGFPTSIRVQRGLPTHFGEVATDFQFVCWTDEEED